MCLPVVFLESLHTPLYMGIRGNVRQGRKHEHPGNEAFDKIRSTKTSIKNNSDRAQRQTQNKITREKTRCRVNLYTPPCTAAASTILLQPGAGDHVEENPKVVGAHVQRRLAHVV